MAPMRPIGVGVVLLAALLLADWSFLDAQVIYQDSNQSSGVKEVTIRARRYAFSPALVEVTQGDIVKITLIAEDISQSFAIDEYRISKRASPGRSVTFEFCADRAGRFVFYCNLTSDEGCRAMRGELIVR